jgi:hypothetical protein
MRERTATLAVTELLARGVTERIFPAAVAEVGSSDTIIWT